mgnify:FL=1
MTSERLVALLHGQPIGWLERSSSEADPTFMYAPDYIDEGTIALSARLPIQSAPFPAERVAPYLQGLLPESSDVRLRWSQQLQVTPDDAFGMLAVMGWDCPGAVQFSLEDRVGELQQRSAEYVTTDESAIGDRIRSLTTQDATWTMPEEHWSLGGQQEKFALARIGDQWLEAHGSAPTTHIIKPGIARLKHQALIEHLTMRAAASVGIDVAVTKYRDFDGAWALVVERFDRQSAPDSSTARIHQEDFCQAVGRTPDRKYEERGGPTARDMVAVINRESMDRRNDLLALADFLIINVVAGAPDGHSKNIALLRRSGGSTMAPLYDLATGLAYDAVDVDRRIALSVGGERLTCRIRRQQWAKASATLGIDPNLMQARVVRLAEALPAAFAEAIEEVGDVPGIDEIADRVLARLFEHCQGILIGLS